MEGGSGRGVVDEGEGDEVRQDEVSGDRASERRVEEGGRASAREVLGDEGGLVVGGRLLLRG